MIGVVFSYFRSALVFVLSFLCCVAGVVAVCVHTPYSYLRVLEIIGVAIIFLALCEAADLCALSIIEKETHKTAYLRCEPEQMCAKLAKFTRRAYVGTQKAILLLMYAQMQIYCRDYFGALVSASDSIVAAGDDAKPSAAILFCELYFMRGDKKFFDAYYDAAKSELDARGDGESRLTSAAIEAMRLSLGGDDAAALGRLHSFTPDCLPPLLAEHYTELCEYIQNH